MLPQAEVLLVFDSYSEGENQEDSNWSRCMNLCLHICMCAYMCVYKKIKDDMKLKKSKQDSTQGFE